MVVDGKSRLDFAWQEYVCNQDDYDDFQLGYGRSIDKKEVYFKPGQSYSIGYRLGWGAKTYFRGIQYIRKGMYYKEGRLAKIIKLIIFGKGNREIRRITGAHTTTIAKVRLVLRIKKLHIRNCPCGQPATHRGWCFYRFQKSTKRQEFMERWHGEKTK